MNELDRLRSMWAPKIKRSIELIVPKITYRNMKGDLHNYHWAFAVGYAFREALDIKYEQRKKDKKPYMVWTQGAIIAFSEGDTIYSKFGTKLVQVKYSNIMGWDLSQDEMYEGSITYSEYEIKNSKYVKVSGHSCTQMQFLELLIYGKYSC